MNSEETLVMPMPEPAHVRLIFTPESMRSTTITLGHSGTILYTVRSNNDYSSTKVADGSSQDIAKINYNVLLPDSIKIRGIDKKLKEWLPDRKRFPVTMNASDGKQYVYKADSHQRLALYLVDNPGPSDALAWFNGKTDTEPAYLALTPSVERIRDEVLCAFIILKVDLVAGYVAYANAGGRARMDSGYAVAISAG